MELLLIKILIELLISAEMLRELHVYHNKLHNAIRTVLLLLVLSDSVISIKEVLICQKTF
jgi:hypothetical protein